VSDSERSVSPRIVSERTRAHDVVAHGDESLTSLAADDNNLAVNSPRRSRRFRRTPTYLRDFDIMEKQHKRGKGAEERRRQRRAALQPPEDGSRSTVRVITESAATNCTIPPNSAFELLGLIDASMDIEIPDIPTADVGVATDNAVTQDASVQVDAACQTVSVQTEDIDLQLPAEYSMGRVARRCRERPDQSDIQVVAAFLADGPPMTNTQRRYFEDMVFGVVVGQRHLARRFHCRLNMVTPGLIAPAQLAGIVRELDEQATCYLTVGDDDEPPPPSSPIVVSDDSADNANTDSDADLDMLPDIDD